MANELRLKGNRGYLYVERKELGQLHEWSIEMVGSNQYSFEAKSGMLDAVNWPFRDRASDVIVELPMKRSTQRFRVMLTTETFPLYGDASRLDAHEAEPGDMW